MQPENADIRNVDNGVAYRFISEDPMETSIQIMKRLHREVRWAGAVWFLCGIGSAVGVWLDISWLKPDKNSGLLLAGFGFIVVLGIFVLHCTEAVLARIGENETLK